MWEELKYVDNKCSGMKMCIGLPSWERNITGFHLQGGTGGGAFPPSHLIPPKKNCLMKVFLLCGTTHSFASSCTQRLQAASLSKVLTLRINGRCSEMVYDHTPCFIRQPSLCVSFPLCRKFLDETLYYVYMACGYHRSRCSSEGLKIVRVTRVEDRVTVTCASFHLTSFAILIDVGVI